LRQNAPKLIIFENKNYFCGAEVKPCSPHPTPRHLRCLTRSLLKSYIRHCAGWSIFAPEWTWPPAGHSMLPHEWTRLHEQHAGLLPTNWTVWLICVSPVYVITNVQKQSRFLACALYTDINTDFRIHCFNWLTTSKPPTWPDQYDRKDRAKVLLRTATTGTFSITSEWRQTMHF